MTTILFDPANPPPSISREGWEWGYISAIAKQGVEAFVSNVKTRWLCLSSQGRLLPVTVNNGEIGGSYVCLPHSAYISYALREIDLVKVGPIRPLLRSIIHAVDRPLLNSGINRIVHIDNWLLSTNLHGDWQGQEIARIRRMMQSQFPDHILAIRSLDAWCCEALLEQMRADGWVLVPSRQIWVTQNMSTDWQPRNTTRNDRRLAASSSLKLEELSEINPADAARIAHLYHLLYTAKYSPLNPAFTPAFITMTHATGAFRYRVARSAQGQIMAVAGSLVRNGILTPPIVGYDTALPQADGLYRLASWLFSQSCAEAGCRLHGSAGAADFKRNRGARGYMEYTAMYVGHLPWRRRAAVQLLASLLERMVVPVMKKYGL